MLMATARRDGAEDRARRPFGFWGKARPNPATVHSLNAAVPVPIVALSPGRCVAAGIACFRNDRVLASRLAFQSNTARLCGWHATILQPTGSQGKDLRPAPSGLLTFLAWGTSNTHAEPAGRRQSAGYERRSTGDELGRVRRAGLEISGRTVDRGQRSTAASTRRAQCARPVWARI